MLAARNEQIAVAGCELLFLPAYSPDLNPSEHIWASFKTRLRKDLPTATNSFLFIDNHYCPVKFLLTAIPTR